MLTLTLGGGGITIVVYPAHGAPLPPSSPSSLTAPPPLHPQYLALLCCLTIHPLPATANPPSSSASLFRLILITPTLSFPSLPHLLPLSLLLVVR